MKGELQVSDKERQSQTDQLFKDIATTVAEKCINPELKRPYPVTIIEKAMKDAHYSVKPNQSAKQQALQVIKLLKEQIPLERAKMRLKVISKGKVAKKLKDKITKLESVEIEKEDRDDEQLTLIFIIDPGHFKEIDTMVQAEIKNGSYLEVLSYKEMAAGLEYM